MIKKIGVVAALLGSMGVASAQEGQNLTFLTLGAESVQYGENTVGITASGPRMNNMIQRSSSYTRVNDDFGFYITTTSTLIGNQNNESWTMSPYGIVQQTQRKVILTDITLDTAWDIGHGLQITGGLGMNTMSFSRSAFAYPKGTRGTATTVTANGQTTVVPGTFAADPNGPLQQLTATGGYLTRSPGAVFEDSTSILGQIGIKYDSFFLNDRGFRLLAGANAGIPLFYYVTNSLFPNTSWTSLFQGYNLHADLGIGFKIKDNFDFIVLGSGDYRYRPATNKIGRAFVPNVTVTILRATAGLSWSY